MLFADAMEFASRSRSAQTDESTAEMDGVTQQDAALVEQAARGARAAAPLARRPDFQLY